MSRILVTGAAGFIGFHVSNALLDRGDTVTGVDNLNDYYDVNLKLARLQLLRDRPGFTFRRLDLADAAAMEQLFGGEKFDAVINLAAQAGVRYSLQNPRAYAGSNLDGFLNVLEGCRRQQTGHLVYASSSSVYGANTSLPFSVHDNVDHPVSLCAATKKANELMAHTYSHLFRLPVTGLRFFTVYGPWGRPDMAPFLFTSAILEGRPLDVFNHGQMQRDFTYIDDIVTGVLGVLDRPAQPDADWDSARPDPASSNAPYRLYNIGNNEPVALLDVIEVFERKLGRTAEKRLLPMQPGDVQATFADIAALTQLTGFRPEVGIEEGVSRFVDWYREFYRV
jgi:UDP-glucuronate 4-epimerase